MTGRMVVVMLVMSALMAGQALAMHHAVKVAEKADVGKYLTDAEGKTLYMFKKDAPGKSACMGECLQKWPIYHRDQVAVSGDLKAADFATLTREDGKKQTTFRGYPLYYWEGDAAPGDTKGQEVKDVWFVIDPGKFPPK